MNWNTLKTRSKQLIRTPQPSPLLVTAVFMLLSFAGEGLCVALEYTIGGDIYTYMESSWLSLLATVVLAPLSYGYTSYAIAVSRGEKAGISSLFVMFSIFFKVLGAGLLIALASAIPPAAAGFISALFEAGGGFGGLISLAALIFGTWAGIYISMSYALVPYLLADNPRLGIGECMKKSRQYMDGHRLEFFTLSLSFFGWYFLGILTAGVLFLWVMPYAETTKALYYNSLTGKASGVNEGGRQFYSGTSSESDFYPGGDDNTNLL